MKQKLNVIDKLKIFLNGKDRNIWIRTDTLQVYVRKGNHLINDKLVTTLDIANIEVKNKNKGIGTKFINNAHSSHNFEVTFIENILNERFCKYLEINGWNKVENSLPPSLYKYNGK